MTPVTADAPRLWTRDFVLALATNFFIALIFYLLMTTMAQYAATRFGASESLAGLAASAFIIGAILSRALGGKLLDFIGRRRSLLIAMSFFVLVSVLYIPVDNLYVLFAMRFVQGVAFGAGNLALAAAVMSLIPARRRGEGTGYFGVSVTFATAVGPFLAVVLLDSVGYTALFVACALFSTAGLITALLLRLPERTPTPDEVANRWKLRLSDIVDPSSLPIATVMLIGGFAYSGVLTFVNGYAQSSGTPLGGSTYFLVYAVFVLVCRLFVGRIQDTRGDNVVIYPAITLFALGMAALAFVPGLVGFVAAGVLVGVGFGSLMPCAQAIAVSEAPPARVGYATSTFFLMLDIGTGVGPIVLGLVVTAIGFPAMYSALTVVVLFMAVVYHYAHGRKPRTRRV